MSDIEKATFVAGMAYAIFRQMRKDLNGMGRKCRDIEGRQERRWKHLIAALSEIVQTKDDKRRIAALLKEDAWRD